MRDADDAGVPAAAEDAPRRRWRDLAILVPVFGTFALMPPLIAIPLGWGALGGVPAIVLYVFGVWAALILVAARLAGALTPRSGAER
ncbi:hypothetical protein [Roseospira goensis]|uniref:Uncharacterized protein n=1 Tax=Roseospira goensis TaxID=391922 RepID=A0A7W6RXK6_9PROT|nr:hypothetical protein [Roseospira goensis]MBB4285078.1 hypothetical protein [Roseospira goensis]